MSALDPLDSPPSGLFGCSESSKLQSRISQLNHLLNLKRDIFDTSEHQVLVVLEEPGGGVDERHLLHPLPLVAPLPLHLHLRSSWHAGVRYHHYPTDIILAYHSICQLKEDLWVMYYCTSIGPFWELLLGRIWVIFLGTYFPFKGYQPKDECRTLDDEKKSFLSKLNKVKHISIEPSMLSLPPPWFGPTWLSLFILGYLSLISLTYSTP